MRCGVEGAIHAVFDMFNSNDYGVLVMDAQNAFNLYGTYMLYGLEPLIHI